MILFWKLHHIAHTDHIWFAALNIVNGTTLSHMRKFLILFIPLSTWIRRVATDSVSTTSSGVIFPLFPGKVVGEDTPQLTTYLPWQNLLCQTVNLGIPTLWQSPCQRSGQYKAG